MARPLIILTIGIISVSTASIFIRFAQEDAPSVVIAFFRLLFATLILFPLVAPKYKELKYLQGKNLLLISLSGFFLAIHFAAWIKSLELTSVASSVVLVTTTPLWVAIFSLVLLREPLRKLTILGMLIALIGGLLVGISDFCSFNGRNLVCPSFHYFIQGDRILGDLLALTGAVMAALYLIIGRKIRANVSLLSYIFPVYGIAAIFLGLVVFFSGEQIQGYPIPTYLWMLLLAIFPQLIGHSSFNWALRYLSAGYVSIVLLGEPIGTTILAVLILQETPSLMKITGGIFILLGILVASSAE